MIKNIRHTGIAVSNLQEALKFYVDILGLKVKIKEKLDRYDVLKWLGVIDTHLIYVKLATEDEKDVIELYYFENEEFTENYFEFKDEARFFDYGHISFTVDDIEALYEKLIEEDIECISGPSIDIECKHKLFFARDPFNNLIEFVEVLK